MTSSSSEEGRKDYRPRDYGLTSASAAAVLGISIYMLAKPAPDVLWRDDVAAATALAGGAVLFGSVVASALLNNRHLLTEAAAATLFAFLFYATIQGSTLVLTTSNYRSAVEASEKWPVVAKHDYEAEPWSKQFPSKFGESFIAYEAGRHLVGISSTRDATQPALLNNEGKSDNLQDFFLEADIEYIQGPSDGYCGFMFGYEKDEQWWAVVFGRRSLTVTQNPGSLPHRYIYDPDDVKPLRQDKPNKLTVLKVGRDLTMFLNGRTVKKLGDLTIANGSLRLAAQSKSRPIWVRCAFDNVLVRGTAPAAD